MFQKMIDFIATPFKSLKVFYQILIIVLIMLVFSGIQGVLGIYTIGKLNENSREIFNKSMKGIAEAKDIQNELSQIQIQYLSDIVKSSNMAKIYFETATEDTIKSKLSSLKEISPQSVKEIEEQLEIAKTIINKPVSMENYIMFQSALMSTKISTDSLTSQTQKLTLDTMDKGNKFSSFANFTTILLWILGAVLSTLVGFVIAFLIASPLNSIGTTANALANGNLTKNIVAKGSIEVTKVVDSLNQAINGLRELIDGIRNQSNNLFIASHELKQASNETGRSATEVAKAMEELSRASSEQAEQTNQAVTNINLLGDLVQQVSSEVKNLSTESNSVAQSAQLGQKATNDVANEIVKIYNMSKEVKVSINELEKTSIEIGEITTVIEGIAEQTTLLALNAAIEAARAGEHGKGFAVVAKETGKLAEQSKNAAQLIGSLINQMKARTKQAAKSMNDGMIIVESGKNLASEATLTFEQIFEKLGTILTRINSVAISAGKMSDSNENMINAVTNIAALSEEGMSSTEEVSATAEEQSALVEQVSALAESLAEIAGKLQHSISEFEINE